MNRGQAGFAFLEVILAVCLATIISGAASAVTIYVLQESEKTNHHLTAVFHADSAAYWISQDTQMADGVTTENLTPMEILIVSWTDWSSEEDSIYHVVTYSIEDISAEVGKLKRTHQDSNGTIEQAVVAEYIYYDPDDMDNTTQVSYQDPILDLKVATLFGQAGEFTEYKIYRRPNVQ